MILLIGSEGSMGKRYQAILKHLNIPYIARDKNSKTSFVDDVLNSEKVIVATPTETHALIVHSCIMVGRDVLCEKPIAKSSDTVAYLCDLALKYNIKLNMVFQYGEIARRTDEIKNTSYDYFRTGNDGLAWDCLQILALASGPVTLKNESPIWKCTINDQELSIQSMDHAYLKFIKKWYQGDIYQPHECIIDCHKKVEEYERNQKN